MNRYNVDVKYKTYVMSSISLDAETEEEAVERLLEALDTSQVEDFNVIEVTLIGDADSFAPSTSTAQ